MRIHEHVVGAESRAAPDLLVLFQKGSTILTGRSRDQIGKWVQGWIAAYPGAIVVMGCNGGAHNWDRRSRESRLQNLSDALVTCGVSADRVRYTDDVVEVGASGQALPDRGIARLMAFRSAALDGVVMPIRDLFRSTTGFGCRLDHQEAR